MPFKYQVTLGLTQLDSGTASELTVAMRAAERYLRSVPWAERTPALTLRVEETAAYATPFGGGEAWESTPFSKNEEERAWRLA
jgi:hypothetical protein